MLKLKTIPLFGSGMVGKSRVVTSQRRLNVYFENREDHDKSKIVCYGTPGLSPSFTLATASSLPVRGMLGTSTKLFVAAYNTLKIYSASGTLLDAGVVFGTTSGQVSMAYNNNYMLLVDGQTCQYYTQATGVWGAVAGFPAVGAQTVTFVSSFFVAEQPGTQTFWVSNANDGSTWNALAFASASSYGDNIKAVDNLTGNLVIFSEYHLEFWQNVGASPEPFQPILSAQKEYGLAAIFSRAHVDESLIFLAQSREGQIQFVKLHGFTATPISNPDIENIINGLSTVSDAVAMAYQRDKHKFYQVTFPTANRSFLYDSSTGLWSDVQTGPSVAPVRHTAQLSTLCGSTMLVSDYNSNQIYTFSDTAYTDNGQTIPREIVTRHILSNFNRIRISALYLDMETGVGLQTGQGVNPQIMLQYSKDNGRTWSAERWVSSGLVGNYIARVLWRRFGSTRDATFKIRMTDPVKFVITEGAMKIREKAA